MIQPLQPLLSPIPYMDVGDAVINTFTHAHREHLGDNLLTKWLNELAVTGKSSHYSASQLRDALSLRSSSAFTEKDVDRVLTSMSSAAKTSSGQPAGASAAAGVSLDAHSNIASSSASLTAQIQAALTTAAKELDVGGGYVTLKPTIGSLLSAAFDDDGNKGHGTLFLVTCLLFWSQNLKIIPSVTRVHDSVSIFPSSQVSQPHCVSSTLTAESPIAPAVTRAGCRVWMWKALVEVTVTVFLSLFLEWVKLISNK